MKLESSRRWIEAGKVLAENPQKKVICPECEKDNLQVLDSRIKSDPALMERMMYCQSCGAKNYLRLIRPIE